MEAFKQGDFQGALEGFSAALRLGEVGVTTRDVRLSFLGRDFFGIVCERGGGWVRVGVLVISWRVSCLSAALTLGAVSQWVAFVRLPVCVCVWGGGIGGRIRPAHPTTHTPTRSPPPTTNHSHQPLTQIHQGMRGVGAQQRTLLSNRAAAYEKLGDLAKALDDCARILREVHFVVYIVVFGVVLMWFCRWFGGAFSVLSNH